MEQGELTAATSPPGDAGGSSIVFGGHMVDRPDRGSPRFPQALAEAARRLIGNAIDRCARKGTEGFAGGARGGDIIFHEECRKRGIPTMIVLPEPPETFVPHSVEGIPNTDWQSRFWSLWNATPEDRRLVLGDRNAAGRFDACNAKLIELASARGKLHLIALWNRRPGDGPGGAADMVAKAKAAGDAPDIVFFPTCFVVMGYGEKSDIATGRKLNLDKTYRNVIRPAVEAAGYLCIRADEIRHSGLIDIPMYEMLFDADLVIADLSTSNLNAMFELGVRHALKPRATIVIAERQFSSPFDVNHIAIRKYEHLGTDIGFDEAMRMQQELKALMGAIAESERPDSPVYALLADLAPPRRNGGPRGANDEAALKTVVWEDSYAGRWDSVTAAKTRGDFSAARKILEEVYSAQSGSIGGDERRRARPRVVQELALATYKEGEAAAESRRESEAETAYAEAISLLSELDPEHTTDPETLGLWGAVHKRRSELSMRKSEDRRADLDIAIYSAERGFLIRQDVYSGVNLAFLLELRASRGEGDESIADRTLANRVRRKVVAIAGAGVETLRQKLGAAAVGEDGDEVYWQLASLAEAKIGLGDPSGAAMLEEAFAMARAPWMVESTTEQIAKLKALRKGS
jgi:hypothetical protein